MVPETIVLVGDSAGGNLVCALTLMAIERGFRVPDGLIMAYPALALNKVTFTPSLLFSIDDPLLPYQFLTLCQNSYIGDISNHPQCDPVHQYFLSPAAAPDHLLAKLPKTRIMIGSNDPLRDESFKFTLQLAKLGVDVALREYMYMPHGFLNFNSPLLGLKQEANETINQCATWMKDFIYRLE